MVVLLGCRGWPAAEAASTQYFTGSANTASAWNTLTMNWSSSPSGLYNTTWVNNNDAVFQGTAGVVNVGAVSADSLTFATDGYTLQGGSIALTGAGSITTSGGTDTISSALGGSVGLTKAVPAR